jgi:hypothetical protein
VRDKPVTTVTGNVTQRYTSSTHNIPPIEIKPSAGYLR